MDKYVALAYVKLGDGRWGWKKVEVEATDISDARIKAEPFFRSYWIEGSIMVTKGEL